VENLIADFRLKIEKGMPNYFDMNYVKGAESREAGGGGENPLRLAFNHEKEFQMRIRPYELKLKRTLLISIGLAVAGVLSLPAPAVRQVSAEPLRIGASRTAPVALIYLADAQGYYKKHGLDVVIKEYEAGALAVSSLVEDQLDIASASEFVFVLQSMKNPDLRMPATICTSSDNELVVRKDRGIAGPQDLRGKRVSVTLGTSGEFFLYTYLVYNRIPDESIQVVNYRPLEMVKAMGEGTVDAALSWLPHTIAMMKQLGGSGAIWPAQSGQDYYQVLLAKETFLKNHPKAMQQFLSALVEAEEFMAKHPGPAEQILRDRLKIDEELFRATRSRISFNLKLSQDLFVIMEREAKWAFRNNLVERKEVPNYLDFLDFNALEKVKPEAVSIVH
jgi:ABC-type nitrate/sulfonate/bicarbonate transport system substrate-binding protein